MKEGNWPQGTSLNKMMIYEKEQNLAILNGKENKKHLDASKQGSWEWTYSSTARNTVRMARLCDFCKELYRLLATTDRELKECTDEAYKYAFSAHHPTAIQWAAWAAIKMVPKKQWFVDELKMSDSKAEFGALHDVFKQLRDNLFNFLTQNQLHELP